MVVDPNNDQAAQAAASLQLLLREDPGLQNLTTQRDVVFDYASNLLKHNRIQSALEEVEGKLALVESLAVKLSRTSPDTVTGHFLQLHSSSSSSDHHNLSSVRDQAARIERQAESLESVASRVEAVVNKGYSKLQTTTRKLERVLEISDALKRVLRLQFECQKLQNYDIQDLRDLTRAAASVAILEDLIDEFENHPIAAVERLRPAAEQTARQVRQSASLLLENNSNIHQLGSILQVYYNLNELAPAVWKSVDRAHRTASTITFVLFQNKTSVRAASDWSLGLLSAAQDVRNLQRVLARKTDPITRTAYMNVLAASPIPKDYQVSSSKDFDLFELFWGRYCQTLAGIVQDVLDDTHVDAAALYPSLRAAALELLGHLQASYGSVEATGGILGGSNMLNDAFLEWSVNDNPQSAPPADSWTSSTQQRKTVHTNLSAVLNSSEWKTLSSVGLRNLEQAFVKSCRERLSHPVQYLFPEHVAIGDDGVAVSEGLSLLPSKYDLQRFDENIRSELGIADLRNNDLSLITMIAGAVVNTIADFCDRAQGALSGDMTYVTASWKMTEHLQHDRKVVVIMFTLSNYLKNAPETTYVKPYRPAISKTHTEAARLCSVALEPALTIIDNTAHAAVLQPLGKALQRKLGSVIARIHAGVYSRVDSEEEVSASFVQNEIAPVLETISSGFLDRFPPPYAARLATGIAESAILHFVSTATYFRPVSESARLHMTQDLADLEMALSQLMSNVSGSSLPAKPYAELRAVRQMLYWTGLDNKSKPAQEVSKSLLREMWIHDVRPSTLFHYLFSYSPSLLSSPHHVERRTAIEYINDLVDNGEDGAWMTIVACCDSYQQRAASISVDDGDSRIAQIVLNVGQELLRRRGRN